MEHRSHNNRMNTNIVKGTRLICAKSQAIKQRIESSVIAKFSPNEPSKNNYRRIKSMM